MDNGAYKDILITGDLNLSNIKWLKDGNGTLDGLNAPNERLFLDSLNDAYLAQNVYFPTFLYGNG